MRAALLLFAAAVCLAETSVAPPSIGMVRDCAGQTYRVYGTAGAFVVERAPNRLLAPGRALSKAQLARYDGLRQRLPGPAGELQHMGSGWLAAWPYAIRITRDTAEIFRLPVPACGGRP